MPNYLRNILITGGNGQLAQAILQHPLADKFQIKAYARDDLDIADLDSLQQAISTVMPDIIINTAAYTAVDKAESETELALRANHMGAKNLAIICQKNSIPLIHLSTDYVFDGTKNSPYLESDIVNPINFYGHSKYLGEEVIREHCEQHIILRISGVFSEHGNNFFKTILRLAKEREELRIVADQITCPTSADDIATTLFTLVDAKKIFGTYHFCSAPPISWFDFADAIVTAAKNSMPLTVKALHAISTADYPTAAKRPAYSVLDCSKIAADYGILQPTWETNIERLLNAMQGST